tara:strand:- start:81 stop:608 length:528 start_codon:yes stop_codon:yes gene_type:complete
MGFIRRNLLSPLFLLVCLAPFFSGCGLLFYLKEDVAHKEMRQAGYELCHIDSCGPEALVHIFKSLGIPKTRIQIGQEIQDRDHTHYRAILGAFNHKFNRITCPPELLNYCRSQELIVTKVSYDSLRSSDVAIILMRGRSHIDDWHWIEWPNKREVVEAFFGVDTKIVSTYLLVKK